MKSTVCLLLLLLLLFLGGWHWGWPLRSVSVSVSISISISAATAIIIHIAAVVVVVVAAAIVAAAPTSFSFPSPSPIPQALVAPTSTPLLVTQTKYMHRALVAAARDEGVVAVEANTLDLCPFASPPELLEHVASGRIEDPDERPLLAGGGQPRSGQVEADGAQLRVVGVDYYVFAGVVKLHANPPLADGRTGQHRVVVLRRQREQALVVLHGVELVQQREVAETVDVDSGQQGHHHAIAPQPDSLHLLPETQLPYAPVLVVVPDHHLVRGVARVLPPAHKGQQIAPEKHLHDCNPAPRSGERAPECLTEGS